MSWKLPSRRLCSARLGKAFLPACTIVFMGIFKKIKREVRIVGIDDGPFERSGTTVLVGAVFRGGQFMDGVLKTDIEVDGTDAQERLGDLINNSKFEDLRAVFTDGITFGGFNTVNIAELSSAVGLPVVAVSRKRPDLERFLSAAQKFPQRTEIEKAVEAAGELFSCEIEVQGKKGRLYFQVAGLSLREAEELIRVSCTRSLYPEPLRAAHLIATAFVRGQSVGRA